MLYVYGIVDSHRFETLPGEGHEAGDVVSVSCGTFAAAVSGLSSRIIAAMPHNVWRHERVLERLMQDHTVLPLRFGTICPNADTLREFLGPLTNDLLNDLERVRGKVELALRIVDGNRSIPLRGTGLRVLTTDHQVATALHSLIGTSNDDEPTGRGAAYLRARMRHHHNEIAREDCAKQLGQLLRQQLDAVLKDVVCAPPADASAGYRASCLVERDLVPAFANALERFRVDHPQFEVTCTGPWPPYSFVAAAPLSGAQ